MEVAESTAAASAIAARVEADPAAGAAERRRRAFAFLWSCSRTLLNLDLEA
jgi:hypothetical protein